MSKKNDIIIFLGPPGAGKGSISKLCLDRFDWIQLSTGALCREHISKKTDIGKKIDFTIKSGKLIPDDLIDSIVEEWLIDNSGLGRTIILDGYPRTLAQAKFIVKLLDTKLRSYQLKIINLIISPDVVASRLANRIVCRNNNCQAVYSISDSAHTPQNSDKCDFCGDILIKRSDDDALAVKQRLLVYCQHEKELFDFFSKNYEILELNTERPFDQVFSDFRKLVNI